MQTWQNYTLMPFARRGNGFEFPICTVVLFTLLLKHPVAAVDSCYGADVVIAPDKDQVHKSELWYGLKAPFGGKLPIKKAATLPIAVAEPLDACVPLRLPSDYAGLPRLALALYLAVSLRWMARHEPRCMTLQARPFWRCGESAPMWTRPQNYKQWRPQPCSYTTRSQVRSPDTPFCVPHALLHMLTMHFWVHRLPSDGSQHF